MAKAYEIPMQSLTVVPAAGKVLKRYSLVGLDTNGLGVPAEDAGCKMILGISQHEGKAGEPCRVMIQGVSFFAADKTLAVGAALSQTAGTLETTSGATVLVGGNSGEIISVLLNGTIVKKTV